MYMRGTLQTNNKTIYKLLILVSCILLYPQFQKAQSSNNWIENFSQTDKSRIELLNQLNLDEDIKILSITNSLINDTIIAFINNSNIDNSIPNNYKTKKKNLSELIGIYDNYINGTKSSIDDIGVYASNVQINIDFVNQYKSELTNMSISNAGSNKEQALQLINYIQTQENIIFNQKQFFTFYSLSGNNHLIKSSTSGGNENISEPINEEPVNSTPTHIQTVNSPQNNTNSENFKYANVIINEEIVESIKVSLSDYEEDTNNLFNITSYDVENLAKVWDSYVYPEELITDTTKVLADTTLTEEPTTYNETIVETFSPEAPKSNNLFTSNEDSESEIQSTYTSSIKGLIYRVQIAASHNQLGLSKINKIYSGTRTIKTFQEEGWYKYYIADAKTLKEAIVIKKESNVPDAFVMAYKDGKKIKYYLKYANAEKGSVPPDNFIDLKSLSYNNLVVVVQVAADQEPLNKDRLSELYQGGKPLNYIYEDGWHKYSFGNYDRFWPANFARRECGTEGAFVVAYKNGEKYNLWDEENEE